MVRYALPTLCYALGGGGVKRSIVRAKCSVVRVKQSVVRAKHSLVRVKRSVVRAKHSIVRAKCSIEGKA